MSSTTAADEPRRYEEVEAFIYEYDPEANEDRDNYTHRRLYIDEETGIIVADTAKFERWLQAVARPNSTPTEQDPTA
ncbi:hypothetical protein [Pseudoclavibacter sp. VKM Ac-2888]|uniref:hypothetical protein n=1 Tax=Pseudoclavibacter sp. VKM Ac-2888 TaxID=2783830 RepID=UPI00188C3850|nr:hypothetical protein [Pseudoclavibacter sp. VKM Ac-2888]MBF4549400.1 hypothetical protein [Pseudoclavibacter sp. VKM Ac-2888]